MSTKRLIWIDIVKIISAFLIVMQHCLALEWADRINPLDMQWKITNFLFIISRMGVPLFFMCSGMTMLRRKHSIKEIYLSSIPTILKSYFCFMLVYGIIDAIHSSSVKIAINCVIKSLIFGRYHTWFIATLIGLYVITPLIQEFVSDHRLLRYSIILSLIFNIIASYAPLIPDARVKTLVGDFKIHFLVGYVMYFLMGYYLGNIDLKKKMALPLCGMIILLLAVCQFLCVKNAPAKGPDIQNIFADLSIIGILLFPSVFLFIKEAFENFDNKKLVRVTSFLEPLGIGIYLIHPLFLPLIDGMHGYIRLVGVLLIYACALVTNIIISVTPLKKCFLK